MLEGSAGKREAITLKTNAVKADRSLYKNGYAVQETEWPTLILIGLNYALFIGLTLYFAEFSWWLILPLAAFQQALFGSLQHEVLHGHPTRYEWLNELLVFPALNLWIPYPIYKKSHLIHHNNQRLTDPVRDPESFYIPEQRWQTMPAWQQAYQRFYHTFAGRILWGPLHVVFSLFYYEARALLAAYEEPELDPARDEALRDYIARREREIPAADALNTEF